MQINSALGNALYGIRKGLDEMNRTASHIAGSATFDGASAANLAQSMVDLQSGRRDVELSVKVLKSVDQTLGTLLDVTA